MSSDMHDLLSRMADELDNYRQLLTDDRREVHALAAEARAALAAAPVREGPSDEELYDLAELFNGDPVPAMRRALDLWGRPATPPTPLEGEVGELVAKLRRLSPLNPLGTADPTITRAAALLQQLSAVVPAVVPVAVSEALIKAECALADVAEGERWCDEGDLLQWAERRCAKALANIRPVMKQHQIRTSEWPPLPAPEGGEVEA